MIHKTFCTCEYVHMYMCDIRMYAHNTQIQPGKNLSTLITTVIWSTYIYTQFCNCMWIPWKLGIVHTSSHPCSLHVYVYIRTCTCMLLQCTYVNTCMQACVCVCTWTLICMTYRVYYESKIVQ